MVFEKFVGCSGYYYNHWKGLFYPESLPKKKWLPYYAEHFNTVEINSSFYHMPLDSTLQNWYNLTPSDFVFTLKGPRFITHIKKLHADYVLKASLEDFQIKVGLLKSKLGCLLWQLPHSQKSNPEKLSAFCKLLDPHLNHVFEFRDISWFNHSIYEILEKYHISLCVSSSPGNLPEGFHAISEIVYLRFHGKEEWYSSNYSAEELNIWKQKVFSLHNKRVYAYFNNDVNAYAVQNAMDFAEMLKEGRKAA